MKFILLAFSTAWGLMTAGMCDHAVALTVDQGNGIKVEFDDFLGAQAGKLTLTLDLQTIVADARRDKLKAGETEATALKWQGFANKNPVVYSLAVSASLLSSIIPRLLQIYANENVLDVAVRFEAREPNGELQTHQVYDFSCESRSQCEPFDENKVVVHYSPWLRSILRPKS